MTMQDLSLHAKTFFVIFIHCDSGYLFLLSALAIWGADRPVGEF